VLRGRRRDARLVAALPSALEAVAAGLRGGLGLAEALERAAAAPGPLASDLARLADRAPGGAGLAAALAGWAMERPLPEVRVVAGALQVALTAGGPTAAGLEGLAEGLRDRRAVIEEARALAAQARLSALVVGAAPVASLPVSISVDGRVLAALTHGPGRACFVGGLALQALAAVWMRRILRPI
jgi:tight adherence protein B